MPNCGFCSGPVSLEKYVAAEDYDVPELVYELLADDHAYPEKMALIGREIYRTAMTRAHVGGYNKFSELDSELFHDTGVRGSDLAKIVGYPSFRAMCLNAPEIVEHFTWTREQKLYGGRVYYEISNFCPIINENQKKLYESQKRSLEEQSDDPIEHYVDKYCDEGNFPTDEELAFRVRVCKTLEECGGFIRFVHLSTLQRRHEQLYNEKLNSDTYRKVLPFKPDISVQQIVKECFHMEITQRPTADKKSFEFKLRNTLDYIRRYYAALRRARDKYAKKMAKPRRQC